MLIKLIVVIVVVTLEFRRLVVILAFVVLVVLVVVVILMVVVLLALAIIVVVVVVVTLVVLAVGNGLESQKDVLFSLKQRHVEMNFLKEWVRVIKSNPGGFGETPCLTFPQKGCATFSSKSDTAGV